MPNVSIIIPARGEQFLARTVQDVLEKAESDFEVLIVHDGGLNEPIPQLDPRVFHLLNRKVLGLRDSTNRAVKEAKGDYILRVDAHCLFDQGFDVKLMADMEENWIVVPSRYSLDPEKWRINRQKSKPINHFYIAYPENPQDWGGVSLAGRRWREREAQQQDVSIDELMMFQGSCWFMRRDYFYELGELETKRYGPYGKGALELLLRCWLTGGKVMRNKKTWYAHLFKGRKWRRTWPVPKHMLTKGGKAINKWFLFREAYKKQKYDLKWLIDRFDPPTWEKCDWNDIEWKRGLS